MAEPNRLGNQLALILQRARRESGRSQAALAAELGVSGPYLSTLERGQGNPTLAQAERVARVYGVELALGYATSSGGAVDSGIVARAAG